ncbi:MAG: sodium:proline symporter, partial [Pseudomonadota bacterium]
RPKASQKELMWISRFALFFISGIAMYLAWWSGKGVLSLVSFSWAGLSATFAAPVVLSLFWRDMTRNGAVLGMTVGALVALLCAWQPNIFFGVYQIVPGMLFSALAVVVGSHIGPKPTLSQKLLFDAVWKRVKLSRRS